MKYKDMTITDIGCGSGLGRRLLPHMDYIGVDAAEKCIEYCKQNYDGTFICGDAAEFIKNVDKLNPIFLFSLDYLDLVTIEQYLQKTDDYFFAVHYNLPYLSSTSVYSGNRELFYEIHPPDEIIARQELLKDFGVITTPLLGELNYKVSILQR